MVGRAVLRARWPGVALELQELSGTDVNGLWKRSDSWQLGMTLVKRAGALTLASSSLFARAAASRGLAALRLADRLPNVQVSLLMRDRAALTPAAQAFAQALQAVARAVQAGG